MKQLNYNHLRYFFMVAREGGVHRAAAALHVTPQTISGQLASMERYLGYPLFNRMDKRLELNEMGRVALAYAEDIFRLGSELTEVLTHREQHSGMLYVVGVLDSIPKIFAYDLLQKSQELEQEVKLVVREGDFSALLSEFAVNKLDLIISDRPIPPYMGVKGFSHLMAESGLTFYTSPSLPKLEAHEFPQCLHGYPILLPGDKSLQKNLLLSWLESAGVVPKVVGEFDDTALMKLFGHEGLGGFFSPTMIEAFVLNQYPHLEVVAREQVVKDQFFAISPQRRVAHPVTRLVINEARKLASKLEKV